MMLATLTPALAGQTGRAPRPGGPAPGLASPLRVPPLVLQAWWDLAVKHCSSTPPEAVQEVARWGPVRAGQRTAWRRGAGARLWGAAGPGRSLEEEPTDWLMEKLGASGRAGCCLS